MTGKERLEVALVLRGLSPTSANARALIMAGQVVVDDHAADKAGMMVAPEAVIRLKGEFNPYVSRGGLKLKAALDQFGICPENWTCLDIGASTGGFTDCLLQHGASKVYALDVGYGQLAWKLREDSRVVSLERQNIRTFEKSALGEKVDLIVADASFISLTLFLPKVYDLLDAGGESVLLVKPQFEVERGQVGKGGVVKDSSLRLAALEKVCLASEAVGFTVLGRMESPVLGAKSKNVEYLVHLKRA